MGSNPTPAAIPLGRERQIDLRRLREYGRNPLVEGRVVDETCGVFGRLAALRPDSLHRFVVGEDERPREMTADEITAELGDPFATLLVGRSVFPRTAQDVLAAIDAATGTDDPLRKQMSFVLGEGSQIALRPETGSLAISLRFVVTRGADPENGPDVLLSASNPEQTSGTELMAWDRVAGGFNFYRSSEEGAWIFAGNSRHALAPPTEGKGPFESHVSGTFIMKELRVPWINWHSAAAEILPSAFGERDPRRDHPWFKQKERGGASTCEADVARPAIRRWAKARFSAALGPDGDFESPGRVMQQVLGTPTANLVTSQVESREAASAGSVDLPKTFFVDSEALSEILGLLRPPAFKAPASVYARSLETFDTQMDDGEGGVIPGDTYFAFLVPEPAFEDLVVLRQALEVGLLTQRLARALVMTDFPNPVFSARREALLAHVPKTATIENGSSTFSTEMAQAILDAAASPDGSPEREFAALWELGEDAVDALDAQLQQYYDAVVTRLGTQEGFDDYYRLAESRRERARQIPIFSEFALLFARTNIPPAERVMRRDGTVTEA